MKFNWDNFTEKDFEEAKKKIKEMDGECIGNVRVGELCFDLVLIGELKLLFCDLYIGGIDTGYGYSNRNGFINYPYDFADGFEIKYKDFLRFSYEELQKDLESEMSDYIEHVNRQYDEDIFAKANAKLLKW